MSKTYTQLAINERYIIEQCIQGGMSQKEIANLLGRDKSVISREISRNISLDGIYRAEEAQEQYLNRRQRKKHSKFTLEVVSLIEERLAQHSSPEEISLYLKHEFAIEVSYESIYQYIDDDKKKGGYLYKLLPHRGDKYKKRNLKSRNRVWKSAKVRKSIEERPKEANDRLITGHWEGDTIVGKNHTPGLLTLTDRKSRYTIIRKIKSTTSEEVKKVFISCFSQASDLIKTVTFDNGSEFALHNEIEDALDIKVYFAHPYSPWERGMNENINGYIRRFFPKGTDFSKYTDDDIQRVQDIINRRYRKVLNEKTPLEVFMNDPKFLFLCMK